MTSKQSKKVSKKKKTKLKLTVKQVSGTYTTLYSHCGSSVIELKEDGTGEYHYSTGTVDSSSSGDYPGTWLIENDTIVFTSTNWTQTITEKQPIPEFPGSEVNSSHRGNNTKTTRSQQPTTFRWSWKELQMQEKS